MKMTLLIRKNCLIFFLGFFIFSVNSLIAQELEIIEYDSKQKNFNKRLPVYKGFIIKMLSPGEFRDILVVKHKRNRDLCSTIEGLKHKTQLNHINKNNYWLDKNEEDGKTYLYIKFPRNRAGYKKNGFSLSENSNYSFLILKESGVINKLFEEYIKNNEVEEFKEKYIDEIKKDKSCIDSLFKDPNLTFLKRISKQRNSQAYEKLLAKHKNKPLNDLIINSSSIDILEIDSEYNNPVKYYSNIKDNIINNFPIESKSSIEHLLYYLEGDRAFFIKTLNGSIDKKLDQIQNLKKSISDIEKLEKILTIYYSNTSSSNTLLGAAKSFKIDLQSNYDMELEKLSRRQEKLDGLNYEIATGVKPDVIEGSTFVMSFKDRNTNRFSPDLGIINYGFQKDFNDVSPYLGFHYNLRAIDKDTNFSQIENKSIWHYLSLSLGATINSVAESGKRDGLIEDKGLMIGLGIRFNHTFRLTTGGLLFKKTDSNPISNKKTLSSTPYLGLSIDFEIKDLINGFSKIFTQ